MPFIVESIIINWMAWFAISLLRWAIDITYKSSLLWLITSCTLPLLWNSTSLHEVAWISTPHSIIVHLTSTNQGITKLFAAPFTSFCSAFMVRGKKTSPKFYTGQTCFLTLVHCSQIINVCFMENSNFHETNICFIKKDCFLKVSFEESTLICFTRQSQKLP